MRQLALLALLFLPALATAQQRQRATLWCELGGQRAVVNGIESKTYEQGSFPGCTVNVYLAGTTTPAVICADDACASPLSNPFTATSTGLISFVVQAEPATVDVAISGSTLQTPFTYPGIQLCAQATCGGATDAVIRDPTATQTVTQPTGTQLGIVGDIFHDTIGLAKGTWDFSSSVEVVPQTNGSGSPSVAGVACLKEGQRYYNTAAAAGAEDWVCHNGGWYNRVAGGDLLSNPPATQVVTQPKGTTFAPNNIHQVHYATNYAWSQTPASPVAIAVGSNVVTINAVLGVSAYSVSKVKHYLWVAATGTPERVLITATTCTGVNTGTCTVTFTAAGIHTTGYTLGTATGGWQEAWVDAFPTNVAANPMVAGKLAGSPDNNNANIYVFNAPPDFDMQRGTQAPIVIDFQGSTVSCNTGGLDCLDIGTGTAGTVYLQPEGLTISNALFIPAIGMGRTANGTTVVIRDKGQKTHLTNISFGFLNTSDVFDDLVIVDADQAFSADHITTNSGNGPPMVCDATYCGSAFKATTTNAAALGYISQSDLSMQCKGNGVDWQSGNTIHILDTTIQAYNQFQVRAIGAFDVNAADEYTNVYGEVGNCTNPLGTGTAGLITMGGWATKQGGVGPSGKPASFTASSVGATQFNYWIVPQSSTLGTGNPLLAGSCLSSGTGTCAIKFNQIGSSGTMTYDILRTTGILGGTNPAPYTAICGGGSVSGCGSVSVGLTTAACSANVCSLVDDITASTSSYAVTQLPTFFPRIDLWPGAIVLAAKSDTNNVHNGASTYFVADKFNQGTNTGGFVTTAGRRATSVILQSCSSTFGNWESGYVYCASSDVTTGTAIAEMLQLGSTPASSIKGRTIYEADPSATSPARDIITLSDSNPSATAATAGGIAASDAGDVAIGYDNGNVTLPNLNLGYRAPIGHRWYVNSIFDNANWKMKLDATALTTTLPVVSTVTTGTAPFTIASTTKVANLNADQTDGVSLLKLTASQSPASVAANTCAEQSLTFTGVLAGDVVYVNKPTAQAGLGIAGVRVVTTNVVGVNFCNVTGTPIVPTASETYSVGVLR